MALRLSAALAWMLLAAHPSGACRESFPPQAIDADAALLMGVATGAHVAVPPGEVVYYDRSSVVPEETNVPVRGYVVRVQAFHHAMPRGLASVFEGSDSKAILVPWGHRGDCKTARWDESAGRWISSPEPAVFTAKLRPVAASDGTPIFDVFSAHFEPYPTAKWIRDRISQAIRSDRKFLSAQEYFIFGASLPVRDPETGGIVGAGRLREWVQENPDLATRWPAAESLEGLRERGALQGAGP